MCFVHEDDGISKNTRRRKEAQGILKGSREVEGIVISFDYHQVLDIDRGLSPPERVGFSADDCHLPLRNIEAIADLRLRYPGLNIVVCSYIPKVLGSIRANDNFVGAVRALSHERRYTSFNRAVFVPQRCGPEGKLEALTSIYPRARAIHLDDDDDDERS